MMKKVAKKFLKFNFELYMRIKSRRDRRSLAPNIPIADRFSHQQWHKHVYEMGNQPGKKILEIGSREVTGESDAREKFSQASYTGFDFYPGENVDIVGDVHKLSSYFPEEEKFDIVYSTACFEHFAMPWVVATEIAKVLKVGGFLFVETHFAFSCHERPWHFFHFTDMALKALFSPALGFECIEAGFSNPIVGRFSSLSDKYLRNKPVHGLYCHSSYFGKKIKEVNDFDWQKVSLIDLVGETKYPEP